MNNISTGILEVKSSIPDTSFKLSFIHIPDNVVSPFSLSSDPQKHTLSSNGCLAKAKFKYHSRMCQPYKANDRKWRTGFHNWMQTTVQLAVLIHHILVQLVSGKVESYHLWLGNSSINLQCTYSFLHVILRNLKQLHCWQENRGPPIKYPKQLHLLIYDCAVSIKSI